MPRVKRGTNRRDSRRKTLDRASGFFLTKSKLNRAAQEAVEKALKYAYVGRKNKKREYRSLWIVRINAGCRQAGISYSKFMHGLLNALLERVKRIGFLFHGCHQAAGSRAALAFSINKVKLAGSPAATSANTLRSRSTPAAFNPCMNLL